MNPDGTFLNPGGDEALGTRLRHKMFGENLRIRKHNMTLGVRSFRLALKLGKRHDDFIPTQRKLQITQPIGQSNWRRVLSRD